MEQKPNQWRFLNTQFGNAFFNMAVDEAVVRSVERGAAPPTFRVFGWTPPAVSFGYAQRVSREVDLDQCRALGVDVVRRPSGGRAVLHWNELTYSVLCSGHDPLLGGAVQEAYRKISACLVAGVRCLGANARLESRRQPVPSPRGKRLTSPCFSSTTQYEVTLGGRKLIGSAQRRLGNMLLQHGSLLIGPEHKQLVNLLPQNQDALQARFRRELDRHTVSLQEDLDRPVSFEAVAGALRAGFQETLDIPLTEAPLSPDEEADVERLVREKYGTDAWNFKDREKELQVPRRIIT